MKKITDKNKIQKILHNFRYSEMIKEIENYIFILEYEENEFVSSPWINSTIFQFMLKGSVSIYLIRQDGSRYSLSNSNGQTMIGETELFGITNSDVFAEAKSKVACIAFNIEECRDTVTNNAEFMRIIAESLANKLNSVTMMNAIPSSLQERVITYIQYHCENKTLNGVESSAFHLHCSPRQLQRILNKLENNGIVKKTGKGTYLLTGSAGIV